MSITKISPDVVDFDSALVVSPTLTIGDATAEDTKIVFDGNAQDYYVGLDDSADELIIGRGSTVGTTPVINISSAGTATFQHPIVLQSGATQGLYIENNAADATTPRITNDANDHTVIRPGKSGGAVQYNNFANDAELMRLADDGVLTLGPSQEAKMFISSTDRFNLATADGLGIQLDKDNNRIAPVDASGSYNNNVSLGSSSLPFKDLHIDRIYFNETAGSGATNSGLDSYEEGTFTMGLSGTTATIDNTTAYYTKIGRLVYFFWYSGASTFASSSGTAMITGLPFAQDGLSTNYGLFQYVHGNAVDGNTTGGYINNNTTSARFVDDGGFAGSTFIDGSAKYIMVQGVYQTDA